MEWARCRGRARERRGRRKEGEKRRKNKKKRVGEKEVEEERSEEGVWEKDKDPCGLEEGKKIRSIGRNE